MFAVVTANVGELDWVAGCVLPAVDQAMDGLDQAVLGDGIEKAYQILVDCIKIHANWGVLKVVVEVVPKLRNGELSW